MAPGPSEQISEQMERVQAILDAITAITKRLNAQISTIATDPGRTSQDRLLAAQESRAQARSDIRELEQNARVALMLAQANHKIASQEVGRRDHMALWALSSPAAHERVRLRLGEYDSVEQRWHVLAMLEEAQQRGDLETIAALRAMTPDSGELARRVDMALDPLILAKKAELVQTSQALSDLEARLDGLLAEAARVIHVEPPDAP